MSLSIGKDHFDDIEYARFSEQLEHSLFALRQLLEQPGFGVGPATVGAELELFLIDQQGRPLPLNDKVRGTAADPRVTIELGRFNLELNLTPRLLAGRPLSAMGAEASAAVCIVDHAARSCGGQIVLVGILPTLRPQDLTRKAISDSPRYQALNSGLRRLRQQPFQIAISGADELTFWADDIALEAANTSWQVHLRVNPADFARTYNAAQLATGPVLAVAGNSPLFFGRRLWEETRIALFEQSADDRDELSRCRRLARVAFGSGWVRQGALELFEEAVRLHEPVLPVVGAENPLDALKEGRTPRLDELRLHQSTVWRWNRAIYDPVDRGHLRIELRALPAGPTVPDMLANTAFLLGLTLTLAEDAPSWSRVFGFRQAHRNFYCAAQQGLDAQLRWPLGQDGEDTAPVARDLALRLLPDAQRGLEAAGVAVDEVSELLGIIEARVRARQTGAAWQRKTLTALERRMSREQALEVMLARYLELAAHQQPVHTWPVED
jgi:gamma-glutamyl:cysteine ligase YbdK (ATP-grasp superfamily)